MTMERDDAEEFTQSLGQIVGGSVRQILLADRLGVPKALGYARLEDWVNDRLGGYAKLPVSDRRETVAELKAEGLSNRKIAEVLGVDERTVRNDLSAENSAACLEVAEGEPDRSAENSAPATRAARTRTAHEEIAKAYFDQPATAVPAGDPIRLGDFYELSAELADASVDLIFTDPPYDEKSIPLFGKMAEVAARVLKPGGSLVTYLGHMQLLEAGALMSQYLRFWHPLACMHAGPAARMTEFGVIETFKPMLWFVRGTRGDKQTFIESSITGTREKDHHPWQQAESEAAYFIEQLTPAGGLVVDFFAGGATTIAAALKLGRAAIGYEIDPNHHATGLRRVIA
jgi:16S rRNA G966 N2-methylase RsmD